MKRDNLFNRIFFRKEVLASKKEYEKSKKLVEEANSVLQYIRDAESLEGLLRAHKTAWAIGFRNSNIGPDKYGKFRTDDILNMKPSEVYLGNIAGLWTLSIPFWESKKYTPIGENGFGIDHNIRIYDLIMSQYRLLLYSNVKSILTDAKNYINDYDNM